MSDLTNIEKRKLEKLLRMGGGYVLDFSNRTFSDFVLDSTQIDIYEEKYYGWSGSKASRLRAFWEKESNFIVAKLVADLLEYWKAQKSIDSVEIESSEQVLYDECCKIPEDLKQRTPVDNIDVIQSTSEDKDFHLLAEAIRESIERNEPETALDRLHTFVVKYVRKLCEKHGISYDKKTPLHSLFGGYVKHLTKNNIIESTMTEKILKSSISVLEAFNDVRNNQSFAHDNPILNYNESLLIFNDVSNVIKFIESIEKKESESEDIQKEEEELPF